VGPRHVGALLAGALLAGGLAASAAASTPTASRCSSSVLSVKAGQGSGAAGSLQSEFAFVNRGSRACTLEGYPRLQMLSASGQEIATTNEHAPPGADGINRSKLLTLAPGHDAWFAIDYADQTGYGNLTCPTAAKVRFTPPGVTGTVTLSGQHARISPYGGTIEHLHCGLVQVTPVTAKPPLS
jgi:hypothetical protein